MLEIDHVIFGVADPVAAADVLREDFGLGAVPGGIHPEGTGNWLIPLAPPQYVELLYIADRDVVAASLDADLLSQDLSVNPLLWWAVRTDDIDAVGRRLNIEPVEGSIERRDGAHTRWRTVADSAPGFSSLPFFIEYEDPNARRPAEWRERYVTARHNVPIGGFVWIELGGDEASLREWLGDASVPMHFAVGPPGLRAVSLSCPNGDVVLRPGRRFGGGGVSHPTGP
jgi:Glyoxalase-like domain